MYIAISILCAARLASGILCCTPGRLSRGCAQTHPVRASHVRAQVGVRIAPEGAPKLDGRLNWG